MTEEPNELCMVKCEKNHILFGDTQVRTLAELQTVINALPFGKRVFCSSSLDWPEDHSTDKDLIYLCDLIRGNNVSGRNPEFNTIVKQGEKDDV